MLPRRLFAVLAIGLFLPGCPFTDGYYVDQGSTQPDGTDGSGAIGGTFQGTGGIDGVGGDSPHGDAGTGDANGMGGSTGAVGGLGSGADTSVGGDSAQGGTAGDTPVAGAGGTMPVDSGGTTSGGRGGRNSGTGGRWSGTGGAMGGSPAAGSGGDGTAGDGAGGTAGIAGGTQYEPPCDDSIVKGSSCNQAGEYCYRACGPDSVGFKRETCTNGAYSEGECQFPASGDYSCYSVPAPYQLPDACPGTVPRAAQACTVPPCTPCFGGMTSNPQYRDSSGTQKTGYCVCNDAGAWTCATSSEPSSWPCPGNPGCD